MIGRARKQIAITGFEVGVPTRVVRACHFAFMRFAKGFSMSFRDGGLLSPFKSFADFVSNRFRAHRKTFFLASMLIYLCLSSTGCGSIGRTVFLTDKDRVYIVPSGEKVSVIWAKKRMVIVTDDDMVLLYKGTYLRLEKEAGNRLLE